MSWKIIRVWTSLILVGLLGECLYAGSIWAKRDQNARVAYTDQAARRIGDTLTIVIVEASKVDNKAKRDLQKETNRSGDFVGQVGDESLSGFTLETGSSNELKSKADYKDERSFEDRVSVVVIDVLPNGNLVVNGTRDRNIAGDVQTIEISGIVRPIDISFDNSVRSERVANFHVVTKNAGISAPYTRPGWLAQILDVLWPW